MRFARFCDRQGKLRFARSGRTFQQQRLLQACRQVDDLRHDRVDEVAGVFKSVGESLDGLKHQRPPTVPKLPSSLVEEV
jgi:hypothetical protein